MIDGDERGVSTVLGYSLALGITMVLISGLVISMGSLVENQRERTVRSELDVIGQKLAADITAADRLIVAGEDGAISPPVTSIRHDTPETVAGSTYTITLRDSASEPELVLETREPAVSVTVTMATEKSVSASSASGGSVRVEYVDTDGDSSRDRLVIKGV
jgi:hypothetical protein